MRRLRLPSKTGFFVALIAGILSLYEAFAINDGNGGIPTISRMIQGVRDTGHVGLSIIWIIALTVFVLLIAFAVWVLHHFIKDKRSSL